ncbi:type II CAAX endopeptidase family protein [Halolamina salifodinae]|uniref:Membrane protease YdiL (CAAX protease family) n=1 Tax=Halolamina salifodinae TaxID=1202767 RepID=A0A8T4GUI1_9EURY|nr:type II CAAX endopeptidase family protein [Halolamina salifodinae]MBP1986546.1 membrane protease YdiL (CAAX protease family) [Halolamina salifodinae]
MTAPAFDAADRHPAATYFALTFALSWGVWFPVLTAVEGPMLKLAAIPGAFGPLVAAAVVTRLRGESVRGWLASTLDWRRSPRWYAAALAVPIGVSLALGAVMVALTGGVDESAVAPALGGFAINVVFATLLGGGQEEFGWRGFALPHLQARYGALSASVVVGAVWALWHAPMFAFGVYEMSPAGYAAFVVVASVTFTWLYNSSRGCVPAAVLMHGALNASVNVPLQVVVGPSALPVPFTVLLVGGFGLVALALVARYGPESLSVGDVQASTWTADRPKQRSTAGPETVGEA